MQVRLSAGLVRRVTEATPPTRTTDYFDTITQRFFLRVRPPAKPDQAWASAYFVRFTVAGVERRVKVADPATSTLDQAREAARTMLGRVDTGGDPAADRREARAAWTLREAAAAYLASREFATKAEKTRAVDRGIVANHLLRHLASVKLETVDVPAARRLVRAIEQDDRSGKRGKPMGGPGVAKKAARLLSAILSWAVNEGRLERNALVGSLRLTGDGQRDTVLTEAADYQRLFAAMDRLVAERRLRPQSRAFIIVACATGCRRGELQSIVWADVDLGAGRLVLRATKGAKLASSGPQGETVHLPPIAAAAIAAIRPAEPHPQALVFAPSRGGRLAINRDWIAARTAASLPDDLALHSLRHSVGTAGIMAGLSTLEVKRLLRHRNVSTTQRYVHLAEAAQAGLAARAMAHLLPGDQPAAEVAPIAKRGGAA